MESSRTHLIWATLCGVGYALLAYSGLGMSSAFSALAAVIFVAAWLLPNIDLDQEFPADEFIGVVSAALPALALNFYSATDRLNLAQLLLVIVVGYLVTRFVCYWLVAFLEPRGMMHSLPMAIISAELVFLLFYSINWFDRSFLALACFCGYFGHLLLDAYGNLSPVLRALGRAEDKPPVMKFFSESWVINAVLLLAMIGLGWLAVGDLSHSISRTIAAEKR